MVKEKRTKPCSNCKKSKVKCIYTNSLPCERCIRNGQAVNCQFVPKLPSLKLPSISPQLSNSSVHKQGSSDIALPPLQPISGGSSQQIQQSQAPRIPATSSSYLVQSQDTNDSHWKSQIESRINTFDSKLNDLVDILKTNQRFMMENHQTYSQFSPANVMQNNGFGYFNPRSQPPQGYSSHPSSRSYSPVSSHTHQDYRNFAPQPLPQQLTPQVSIKRKFMEEKNSQNHAHHQHQQYQQYQEQHFHKKQKIKESSENPVSELNDKYPEDFRDGFLNKLQAYELFNFFDANISPQLFGFEISKFSVDLIWESSPILICAICTIASIHHPNETLSKKSTQLQKYLHQLCGNLLYKGKPCNEVDGFNAIVALILCSFWLSDSQMFTGLALHLAKDIGLNSSQASARNKNGLSEKDRLKLWYLLYVLDGQQSLTFNRQPLVNSQEYSLKHSREILLTEDKKSLTLGLRHTQQLENGNDPIIVKTNSELALSVSDQEEIERRQRFTDMRLVSQVEYNQALNEAFRGNAWDLLVPSSFGIPSKSNLELDKWMVSWTVLLSPGSNGTVWSSKSTLIYYNFAKMHINSSAVRHLEVNAGDEKNMLPKWNNNINSPKLPYKNAQQINEEESDTEDSSSDDDEFISNKELLTEDETIVSANIAVNAAQTVLNLVLNDNDILDNLKYVPVHIHIMLYYAALLLINPQLESNNRSIKLKPEEKYNKIIANLKIVKNLQKKIYLNLPTDKSFGNRLIRSLDEAIQEKLIKLKNDLNDPLNEFDKQLKDDLNKQLSLIAEVQLSDNIKEIMDVLNDSSSRGSSPGPERISAWPGSNHGHP